MSPAQSHTIGSPEERLHYRSWPAPVADAPGLLLVHGFGAHSHWWDACAPYLARNFRVVAMDLAGMGDSAHRSCYSQRQFADDMARVIHAAQLAPAILVAHSFGGIMASWFAHYHESLLQALVLVDARLGFPGDKDDRQLDVAERPDRLYPDYASARARFRLIPEDHVAHPAGFITEQDYWFIQQSPRQWLIGHLMGIGCHIPLVSRVVSLSGYQCRQDLAHGFSSPGLQVLKVSKK